MHRSSKAFTLFVYQVVDLTVVAVALTALYAVRVADSMPDGMESFLAARVTVRNTLLCGCFLLYWNLLSRTMHLYTLDSPASIASLLRLGAACIIGSLVSCFLSS